MKSSGKTTDKKTTNTIPRPSSERRSSGGNSNTGSSEWTYDTVETYMTTDPVCCLPSDPLTKAARLMKDEDCGAIPVVNDKNQKEPVGIITDRDIVCRVVAEEGDPSLLSVEECMSQNPVTVSPETSLSECLEMMEEHKIRRIIVVDSENRCCGIVAQADIALLGSDEKTAEIVREVSEPDSLHPAM